MSLNSQATNTPNRMFLDKLRETKLGAQSADQAGWPSNMQLIARRNIRPQSQVFLIDPQQSCSASSAMLKPARGPEWAREDWRKQKTPGVSCQTYPVFATVSVNIFGLFNQYYKFMVLSRYLLKHIA